MVKTPLYNCPRCHCHSMTIQLQTETVSALCNQCRFERRMPSRLGLRGIDYYNLAKDLFAKESPVRYNIILVRPSFGPESVKNRFLAKGFSSFVIDRGSVCVIGKPQEIETATAQLADKGLPVHYHRSTSRRPRSSASYALHMGSKSVLSSVSREGSRT
jgi:hypothetical protein